MIQRVLFEKCPNCRGWKYNLYDEMEDKTGKPMGSHSLGPGQLRWELFLHLVHPLPPCPGCIVGKTET